MASMIRVIFRALRLLRGLRPCNRYQALTPATTKPPVMNEASAMWAKR
jgi:hypothetical protein